MFRTRTHAHIYTHIQGRRDSVNNYNRSSVGSNEESGLCQPYMPSISYKIMKWKKFWQKKKKQQQSIKPSNGKYVEWILFPLTEDTMEIIRMKVRSLFVCKWEIDYIYLLAQKLWTAHLAHTHTHKYTFTYMTHTKSEASTESLIIRQLFFPPPSVLRPSPPDRGKK